MRDLKRNYINELIHKTETDSQIWRPNLMVASGEGRRKEIVTEFGIHLYTLLYLKDITKTYCVAQGTLLNVIWKPGQEGSLEEKGYMYLYG